MDRTELVKVYGYLERQMIKELREGSDELAHLFGDAWATMGRVLEHQDSPGQKESERF